MSEIHWRERFVVHMLEHYADRIAADDRSAHETVMVDPKQNTEFDSGTQIDQIRLALNTLAVEFQNPDGVVLTAEDVHEAADALNVLETVVSRIETKLAAFMAKNNEKPRSDR